MSYYDQIQEAKDYILSKVSVPIPKTALVLGTGLGDFVDHIEIVAEVHFRGIPHFRPTSVVGHKGKFIFAKVKGVDVLILQGRYHNYEGHNMLTVTLPIRVLKALGIESVIMTNAAGGLNPEYKAGSIVAISDHINLHPENPLKGPNDDRLGIRFPDMSNAYDLDLRNEILSHAKKLGIEMHQGVYAGLQGPNLETPAEYKYLRIIGGDLVGMSTIPEVIVARHAGLKVAAISVVSNVCYPPEIVTETTVEEVISTVHTSAKDVFKILDSFLGNWEIRVD